MYQPTLGRFLSRDPLPANGPQILHPFPDMKSSAFQTMGGLSASSYVYARSNPVNLADPLGLQPDQRAPGPGRCTINVVCARLVLGIFGLGPKHCGIETVDSRGIARVFHVFSGTCAVYPKRPQLGLTGDYFVAASFVGTDRDCACIADTAALITSRGLPYEPVPSNDPCGLSASTCNSNYTSKCLLRNCGLGDVDWSTSWFGTPVGWDHRMSTCVVPKVILHGEKSCATECKCLEWRSDDTRWCGPPPELFLKVVF